MDVNVIHLILGDLILDGGEIFVLISKINEKRWTSVTLFKGGRLGALGSLDEFVRWRLLPGSELSRIND